MGWWFTKKASAVETKKQAEEAEDLWDGKWHRITGDAFSLQQVYQAKWQELMQEQYNILCKERGTYTVTEEMVATAYYRLMDLPHKAILELSERMRGWESC